MGAVPKLQEQLFPERHMGLVPTPEHSWASHSIQKAVELAEQYLDLDKIVDMAFKADKLPLPDTQNKARPTKHTEKRKNSLLNNQERLLSLGNEKPVKVGIFKDAAFRFYYPENIDALIALGAQPEFISPFDNSSIPDIDALYIGGGFPETHAKILAENVHFREQLKSLAKNGLPIYAECGGLMFLGEALELEGVSYPMVGVFPVIFGISKQPQGHGYTIVLVEKENPYFEKGTEIRGHEFHYSYVVEWKGSNKDLVFRMKRGTGFLEKKDGLCYKNVLATFTHLHALGTPSWAKAMVRNAIYSPLHHKKRAAS
jgi:cobyrinic acid a,c-diamide synthase